MMMIRFFLYVCLVTTSSIVLRAQWKLCDNMESKCIQSILMMDNEIMGGSTDGIYKSTNGGVSWYHTGGLNTLHITKLIRHGTLLFAGSWGNGVYRSSDNGEQWYQPQTEFDNQTVYRLISMDSNLIAITHYGVFVTNDYGLNWVKKLGKGYDDLTTIETRGDTIYFEDLHAKDALMSTDNGENWITVNKKIFVAKKEIPIGDSVLILDKNGMIIIAGKEDMFYRPFPQYPVKDMIVWGKYIVAVSLFETFISDDNGLTWKSLGIGSFSWNEIFTIDNLLFVCNSSIGQRYCDLPSITSVKPNEEPDAVNEYVLDIVADELIINSVGQMECFPFAIYDALGVKRIIGVSISGQTVFSVSLHGLSSGIFFFTTEINGKRVQEKFVVVR